MNKAILGSFAIFAVAILAIGSVSAFYGNGFGNSDLSEEEIAEMQEFRDSVQTAIEEGNYEEWKSLMGSQLTEERFNQLVERHSEMSEMRELREQMRQAWEDGDYETLEELREQMPEDAPFKEAHQGKGMREGKPFLNRIKFWGN